MSADLCEWTAVALAGLLATGEVSATEVLDAHLGRIARVNPSLNAIVTLDEEGARARAAELDAIGDPEARGPLHGLPIAVKDLEETAGMRTTFGSRLLAGFVPDFDTLMVQRMRAAGAVIIGKTNTPEFGTGSQTFNAVFGATLNPWDPTRTPGGSSGGAAAAVAAGMLPFADGSDLGGSIRNPSSFCNLVGLRPTPGRVPAVPTDSPWDPRAVLGPIARTAADAALLLGALAGPDPRAPLSLSLPGGPAGTSLTSVDPAGVRIAWTSDLGDLPIAPDVTEALAGARRALEAAGCAVIDVDFSLPGADEAFEVLRGVSYARNFGPLLERHGDLFKDTVIENVRFGQTLGAERIGRATAAQGACFAAMRELLAEGYDALALPAVQVAPFPVEEEWVREIDGVAMGSYLEWMRACSRITMTAHPAASVPAAFTKGGLPVGLQLVGRYGDDWGLLSLAATVAEVCGVAGRRPPDAI